MADIHFYWEQVPETVPEHEQYVLYVHKDIKITYAVVTKRTFSGRLKEWRIRCIPLDIDCLVYTRNVEEAKRECEERCLEEMEKWIEKVNQVFVALRKSSKRNRIAVRRNLFNRKFRKHRREV